jgi:hypothetical protein
MNRWREELGRIEWATIRVSDGPATSVPEALIRLSESSTIEVGWKEYWMLDNSIVVQGNLFSAAEAAAPFVVELAINNEDHVRVLALELLIQLAGGVTHSKELELGNDYLDVRCRKAVSKGLAFFYTLLDSSSEEIRDRAVELIGLTEDDSFRKSWTMRWVAANDPSDKTRDLAEQIARENF